MSRRPAAALFRVGELPPNRRDGDGHGGMGGLKFGDEGVGLHLWRHLKQPKPKNNSALPALPLKAATGTWYSA